MIKYIYIYTYFIQLVILKQIIDSLEVAKIV